AHAARLTGLGQPVGAVRQSEQPAGPNCPARAGNPLRSATDDMAYGLGVAKGMLTTISHLVKPPVTIQYPEERLQMPIWTRGRPRLIYEVDTGELRCTACGACALACPVDVIKLEQHPSPIQGKILDR